MQQDYFGFKRSKGGAKYTAPPGYVPSDYWSMYANSFAQDGSDEQLIAAMTHSVPQEWLKKNGFVDPDTMPDPDLISGKLFSSDSGYRSTSQSDLDRGEDYFMGQYGKALTSRLRNDFKKNKAGMEAQGIANLRDQSQDALQDDFKGIDADANARGLLYSGKRQAARGAAAGARANELGQLATDFSQGLSDTERQLNSDVFGSEIQTAANQADINDILTGSFYNKLQRNLGQFEGQANSAASLGQGLGSISGALASRLQKKQTPGSLA